MEMIPCSGTRGHGWASETDQVGSRQAERESLPHRSRGRCYGPPRDTVAPPRATRDIVSTRHQPQIESAEHRVSPVLLITLVGGLTGCLRALR